VVQVVFFPGFIDPDFRRKRDEAEKKRAKREEEIRKNYRDDPDRIEEALKNISKEIPIEGTPVSVLIDHIEHISQLVGPDHVGLGADWDGVGLMLEGLEDCSKVPCITLELVERGFGDEEIIKILGGNLLRVMEEVERVAAEIR
jgi:membrane dipeptidase